MDLLARLLELLLHLDEYLQHLVEQYGTWSYLILFAIVFCETGLVVAPFLPGDSLLFAAGAFAATGALEVEWLLGLLFVAAVVGDAVNYAIGHYVGPRVLTGRTRLLKREYLERTELFFAKYGGKAIILARFLPIVRTVAPFLAGVGSMHYPRFAAYNVIGAALWVGIFTLGGYYFGSIEFVKRNFEIVIVAIIFISVLPALIEWWNVRRVRQAEARRGGPQPPKTLDSR